MDKKKKESGSSSCGNKMNKMIVHNDDALSLCVNGLNVRLPINNQHVIIAVFLFETNTSAD